MRTPDAAQALRLRRFTVAALSYLLAVVMMGIGWAFGKVPAVTVLEAAAGLVALNAAFYAVIRSGLNLRLREPSLTRLQILAAITVLMYVVYHMDDGRSVALFGCFIVFLFGIFRLSAREFLGVTVYTLAAHAAVIYLLLRNRPGAIADLPGELMSWFGLAGFLPCFVLIGAQISGLRRQMRAHRDAISALTQMASDYYWQTDASHRFTGRGSADSVSERASPFEQGPQMGQRRWEIPYVTPGEAAWAQHRADLDAHRPFRGFELSRRGTDGTERYLTISGDPVFDGAGVFQGYRGVAADITERKRAEQALRDAADGLRLFADSVPAMTASWDANLHCRFANRLFTQYFGLADPDPVGRTVRELAGEAVYAEIAPHFEQVLQGHPVTYRRTHVSPGGNAGYLEVKLMPQFGAQGRVLGCFELATDITEHKLAEQRLQRAADHDGLTGLPNKLLFHDRLERAIALARRESGRFAVLYLDLDGFKQVNDALGHAAGDALLKEVATRLRAQVRESDTVARVGGDEFNVILPGVNERHVAAAVAAKIAAALERRFELEGYPEGVHIGGSVGVALYPADGANAAELVAAADAAMYRAKPGAKVAS